MRETASVADVPAQTIDVAGTPVALRRRGEGRPLLFLHGAGFTGRWLRFHEAVAESANHAFVSCELPSCRAVAGRADCAHRVTKCRLPCSLVRCAKSINQLRALLFL